MQGLCIHAPDKSNLVVGESYFLFAHNGLAYHASRFPRPGSHFGTYQKSYFEILAEVDLEVVGGDWPPEPIQPIQRIQLDKEKVYTAELVWRRKGYSFSTDLGVYYIKPVGSSDCYFYSDKSLQKPQGRFPLCWFANIEEFDQAQSVVMELPRDKWEQMDIFEL